MADLAILEPRVLNGVIRDMPPADGLLGHSLLPRVPNPDTYFEYDIISRRRRVARPNTPNSPAQIVDQQGVGKLRGGLVYHREKKVFKPTVVRWLRQPGEMAAKNATREILREVAELMERADRFEEFMIWRMLANGTVDLTNLGHNVTVDYQIDPSHQPTVATFWTSPQANIIVDLQDVKRIVSRDSDATLNRFIGNNPTISVYYRHQQVQASLNDAQKGAFATSGIIPGFQGITFQEYDRGYVDDFTNPATPTFVTYIPDGYFVGIADGGEQTFALLDGPAADHDAPEGHIGRFAKTWREPDPSELQHLLEGHFMPVLYQPDHLVQLRVF